MAWRDNVKETTTTTGTGALTLAGAVSTFVAFSSAFGVGDRVHYRIESSSTEWEVGLGTLSGASTLTRDDVYASSNGGALVNFSAGTKNVYCTLPAREVSAAGVLAAQRGGFGGR